MPDILKSYNDVTRRNVDMNDGTWAERFAAEPLGIPAVARQLTATSASANTALTTTCRRVSLYARGADIRYLIGSTSQTASATSHFLANGERVEIRLPNTPNIGVIRASAIDAILEVTELL